MPCFTHYFRVCYVVLDIHIGSGMFMFYIIPKKYYDLPILLESEKDNDNALVPLKANKALII